MDNFKDIIEDLRIIKDEIAEIKDDIECLFNKLNDLEADNE